MIESGSKAKSSRTSLVWLGLFVTSRFDLLYAYSFVYLSQPLSTNNSKDKYHVHAHMLSHVWLFATLWTVACQAPQSMEFSRQEYWSRLPFPSPGRLPHPGIQSMSLVSPLLAGVFFTSWTTWKLKFHITCVKFIINWNSKIFQGISPPKLIC